MTAPTQRQAERGRRRVEHDDPEDRASATEQQEPGDHAGSVVLRRHVDEPGLPQRQGELLVVAAFHEVTDARREREQRRCEQSPERAAARLRRRLRQRGDVGVAAHAGTGTDGVRPHARPEAWERPDHERGRARGGDSRATDREHEERCARHRVTATAFPPPSTRRSCCERPR